MPDGDFDDFISDDLLFGDDSSDLPDFLTADEPTAGITDSPGAGTIPAGEFGRISYDRGDNEIVGVPTSLDGDYVPRARVDNRAERDYAGEQRDREATDTGYRQLGGVAGYDSVGVRERTDGKHSTLEDAGNSIRASIERPDEDTGGLDHRVANWLRAVAAGKDARLAGEQRNKLTQNNRRTTTVPPSFTRTEFHCEFYGLKMNNAGYWMLTVRIENSDGESVQALSRSVGLNLHTVMQSEGFA